MPSSDTRDVWIGSQRFRVTVHKKVSLPPEYPRLALVGYHHNPSMVRVTQVALQTLRKFTDTPVEIWVVDNASPREYARWLLEEPGVNAIFNHTEPLNFTGLPAWRQAVTRLLRRRSQVQDGSFANGAGIQLAAGIIDPETQYFGVFHNDIVVCKKGWLSHWLARFDETTRVVAAALHKAPKGIPLPVACGYLIDFPLVRQLKADFLPNMPEWDAAELPPLRLLTGGYSVFTSPNTHNEPELAGTIPHDSPFASLHHVLRSFDQSGDIYYMHLGRGTPKTAGTYWKTERVMPEQWIEFAERHLLS